MKNRLASVLVGLVLAGGQSAVAGNSPIITSVALRGVCHPGTLATCHSVHLRSITTSAGTTILATITNNGNADGNLLNFLLLAVNDPQKNWLDSEWSYGPISTSGSVEINGPDPSSTMDIFTTGIGQVFTSASVFGLNAGSGIYGCMPNLQDPDLIAGDLGYYRVCARDGFSGSVTVGFRVAKPLTLADFDMIYEDSQGLESVCGNGRTCVVQVVPEPATIALTATGLVIVGLVGRRRRRAT